MDYKKYSLENLENWLHDAMSAGEATPHEIYDLIVGVVKENYYTYKQKTSEAYELLALLNGNGEGKVKKYDDSVDKILSCDKNDSSPECQGAWNDFWESNNTVEYELREAEYYNKEVFVSEDGDIYPTKDKVVKWQLPVQVDGLTGECYVNFPDDLLERAGLKEGDTVEWIDRNDGSFELRKVNGTK
jgi:hypothetical protein